MQNVEWMDGWVMDTPQTVMTTRAPAVLKIVQCKYCTRYNLEEKRIINIKTKLGIASPTPSYTGNKGVIQVRTSMSASEYLDTNTLQLMDTRGHKVEDVAAASVSGNLYPFCPSC